MKRLTIRLAVKTILDAVKSEAFMTGISHKAVDGGAAILAYQEQAGDDEMHLRMMHNSMVAAAESVNAFLSDYALSSLDITDDYVAIRLTIPERFNPAFTDTLPRIVQTIICRSMLVDWWRPISHDKSEEYKAAVDDTFNAAAACFNRIPPHFAKYPFTKKVSVGGPVLALTYSDTPAVLPYVIDDGAIDDIEANSYNKRIARVKTDHDSHTLIVKMKNLGEARAIVYSSHNDIVRQTFTIVINE